MASGEARECALCEKLIPIGEEILLETDVETSYFRCPHCALTAQAQLSEASSLIARSPVSLREIRVRHAESVWSVSPESAVFLSLPETSGECIDRHRIFTDREEFDAYIELHPEFSGERVRAYTLDELVQILAAGLPVDSGERAGAAEPETKVVVVGMLTHLPFKSDVLPSIVAALEPFEGSVGRQFIDANEPAGRAILGAYGIHEHLPVVIFVNGRTDFELDGRQVRLRGFPGETAWTRADLEAVLRSFD